MLISSLLIQSSRICRKYLSWTRRLCEFTLIHVIGFVLLGYSCLPFPTPKYNRLPAHVYKGHPDNGRRYVLLPNMIMVTACEGLVGHPTSSDKHWCAAQSQNVSLKQIVPVTVEAPWVVFSPRPSSKTSHSLSAFSLFPPPRFCLAPQWGL